MKKSISKKVLSVILTLVMVLSALPLTVIQSFAYDANFLTSNMFYDSDYYNNDLAYACARLSDEIYSSNLSQYFPAGQSEEYSWSLDSNVFKMVFGYKTIYINGSARSLITIVLRGTSSFYEGILDFCKDITHWSLGNGHEALNGPYKYYSAALNALNQFTSSHSEVKDHPLMYLVTGHSLGGAAANLLGAELTRQNSVYGSDRVFVYTFGAIKTITEETNVEESYKNIFNIYNYYDSFGPHGNYLTLGASDPYYKFGRTLFCYYDNESDPFSYNNHDMGQCYVPKVLNDEVNTNTFKVAGVLDNGNRWTLGTAYDSGWLKIIGSGSLGNDLTCNRIPWYRYADRITTVDIQNGITNICPYMFCDCSNYNSIFIPSSITSIGDYAFQNCNGLSRIYFDGTREQWDAINVDYDSGNTALQNATLYCYGSGSTPEDNDEQWTNYILERGSCGPNITYTLYSDGLLDIVGSGAMTSHPWTANNRQQVINVKMSDGITNIMGSAFSSCKSLTSIAIPDSVTSIGSGAFDNCTSLASITIPDSVTSIGSGAFMDCISITSITIPDSMTSIGNSVFSGCSSLTSITIANSVTNIANFAFSRCTSLTSINIPNSVTIISDNAFQGCSSLISVTIPDSVSRLGSGVFEYCSSLRNIIIPDSVTRVDGYLFRKCVSLTSIIIPNGVTSIGKYAFSGCTSLTNITIPDSVTSIGSYAFDDCTKLTTIYGYSGSYAESFFASSTPRRTFVALDLLKKGDFDNDGEATINDYVFIKNNYINGIGFNIAQQYSADLNSDGVVDAFDLFYLDKIINNIGLTDYTYSVISGNNAQITGYTAADAQIKVPAKIDGYDIIKIYNYAFKNNTNLTKVTLSSGIKTIGYGAFLGCSALEEVVLSNTVTSIGTYAFKDCSSLTKIIIPASVTSINANSFTNCTNVTIYGKTGSYAETYANNNSIPFVAI